MLEGNVVHLPAPKTHYSTDICLQRDTPILATGKGPLIYVKNGVTEQQETDMMSSRWRILKLHHQVPREAQREIPPCRKCSSLSSLWVALRNHRRTKTELFFIENVLLKLYTLSNYQLFTSVHNGSHNLDKIYCSFSFIGNVNRCEPLNSNISTGEPSRIT